MSFIHKRGRRWWYYWSEGGRKSGRSLKTDDKVVAEIKKGEEDRRRAFHGMGMASPDSRWEDFQTEYLAFSKSKKGAATWAKDKSVLEAFSAAKPPPPDRLQAIDQRFIETYLGGLADRTSKANANVHYRHLKAAFRKAVAWSHLVKSPFDGVKQFRLEERVPRFLSKQEIGEMLSKARKDPHPDAYGLAMAFLWTGMRLSGVLGLKWVDVDFQRGSIRAFEKGGKERYIPLTSDLRAVLKKRLKVGDYVFGGHERMSLDTVQHIFRDRLLPTGTSIHTLRHTFASHAIMSDVDVVTLKDLLGHKSIATTMIYTHLHKPHVKKAMGKVRFR